MAVSVTPLLGTYRGGTLLTVHHADFSSAKLFVADSVLNCTTAAIAAASHCCCTPPASRQRNSSVPVILVRGGAASRTSATKVASFRYFDEPSLLWLRPAHGPAAGGVAVTLAAHNWPLPPPPTVSVDFHKGHSTAAATFAAAANAGAKCRFGGPSAKAVPATILPADVSNRMTHRARKPTGETWLRCMTPPGPVSPAAPTQHDGTPQPAGSSLLPPPREVPIFLSPNGGADYFAAAKFAPSIGIGGSGSGGGSDSGGGGSGSGMTTGVLTYRYEAPSSAFDGGAGEGLSARCWPWLGAGMLLLALSAIARAFWSLQETVRSSGWGAHTPAHFGALRAAARDTDEYDEEEQVDDVLDEEAEARALALAAERQQRLQQALALHVSSLGSASAGTTTTSAALPPIAEE